MRGCARRWWLRNWQWLWCCLPPPACCCAAFEKMRSVDLGFHADHTLTAAYSLPRQQYSTQAAIDAFNLSHAHQAGAAAGRAGGGRHFHAARFWRSEFLGTFTPEGYIARQRGGVESGVDTAGDGRLLPGSGHSDHSRARDFTPADRDGAPLVDHREPHPGRALLARPGPHRQTSASRPDGGSLCRGSPSWERSAT